MDFIPGFHEVPFEVYLERGIIVVVLYSVLAFLPIASIFKFCIGIFLFFLALGSVLATWDLLFL